MKKRKILIILLLLLFAAPVLISAESSGRPEGLTVSPPLQELNIKQGESVTKKIKVTNPIKQQVKVYPIALDFTAKGETGEPDFLKATDEKRTYSLANWITFSKNYLVLEPQEVEEYEFTIKSPQDSEPGGHYGAVFFSSEPPKASGDVSQVTISTMVGSLILVKTPGFVVENAQIETYQAPYFSFNPPVDFNIRISNMGNVHFKPKGDILVKDLFGKAADTVKVNAQEGNVLPGTTRRFEAKWEPKTSILYPIGRYTAEIKLKYGDSQKELTAVLVFWIIPLWFIILIAVTILFIIYMVFRKRRKKKNNPKDKNVMDLRK